MSLSFPLALPITTCREPNLIIRAADPTLRFLLTVPRWSRNGLRRINRKLRERHISAHFVTFALGRQVPEKLLLTISSPLLVPTGPLFPTAPIGIRLPTTRERGFGPMLNLLRTWLYILVLPCKVQQRFPALPRNAPLVIKQCLKAVTPLPLKEGVLGLYYTH